QAAAAPVAVLNTSYFLHVTNYTRAFTPNDLVIADEADLLEDALLGCSEYEVPTWIGKRLQLEYPKKGVRKPTLVKWLNDVADRASAWLSEHAQGLEPKDRRKFYSFLAETKMVAQQVERAGLAAAKHEDDNPDEPGSGHWVREYATRTLKLLPVVVSQYGAKHLW